MESESVWSTSVYRSYSFYLRFDKLRWRTEEPFRYLRGVQEQVGAMGGDGGNHLQERRKKTLWTRYTAVVWAGPAFQLKGAFKESGHQVMKTIKLQYPVTVEALDISDDIWACLNLPEIAAFHLGVMLHFRKKGIKKNSYLQDYTAVLYEGIMQR